MRSHIDVNGFYSRRRVNKNNEGYICPPGKHWVPGHYKRRKLNSGVFWVKGYCAKNGTDTGMKVREIQRTNKIRFPPFFESEKTTSEVPVENGEENGGSDMK